MWDYKNSTTTLVLKINYHSIGAKGTKDILGEPKCLTAQRAEGTILLRRQTILSITRHGSNSKPVYLTTASKVLFLLPPSGVQAEDDGCSENLFSRETAGETLE